MELKQLQYFVVSVDMGSLSQAAEVLYTTQSHVSKTIKSLEKELGIDLLLRTPTGVVATEEGRQVYAHAHKLLSSAQSISNLAQGMGEQLRIISMPSGELARMLAAFFAGEEGLFVDFWEAPLERTLHQVAHRRADLGFAFVPDYQQQAVQEILRHKRLEFHTLKETRPVLYAGPRNPYFGRESVSFAELQKIRYVQDREEGISLLRPVGHLRDNLLAQGSLKIAAVVSSDHAMMQLLLQTDLGNISCLLREKPFKGEGSIRAVEIGEGGGLVRFGYVCCSGKRLSRQEGRFLGYLRRELGKA